MMWVIGDGVFDFQLKNILVLLLYYLIVKEVMLGARKNSKQLVYYSWKVSKPRPHFQMRVMIFTLPFLSSYLHTLSGSKKKNRVDINKIDKNG